MTGRFFVTGTIADVVTCNCTADRLTTVCPAGWGVGAGAVAGDPITALERIVDTTFLFSKVFVSPRPGARGVALGERELEADGREYHTPTMAWFVGSPQEVLPSREPIGQTDFLEQVVWPACTGAAAVGVVALVHVRREDLALALISRSVAAGTAQLPAGHLITEGDCREQFFDLAPLGAWRPGFLEGLAWFVGVSVRHDERDGAPPEVARRMSARSASARYTHHCHLVLVDRAPELWQAANGMRRAWPHLEARAEESLVAQAGSALAVHSDPASTLTPVTSAVWTFGRDEVAVFG